MDLTPFMRLAVPLAVFACVGLSACGLMGGASSSPPPSTPRQLAVPESIDRAPTTTSTTTSSTTTSPSTTAAPAPSLTRPDWLGQRTLATDDRGFGIAEPTPPELIDRRLPTIDTLLPPAEPVFAATIGPFEGDPLARSTWFEGCPVDPEALSYITVTFWGFDGLTHTGELVVAEEWAEDIVGVFEVAWNERFPFEEMRIVTPADLEADPTGDGNNTASYVCRAVTGGTRFSEHAKGLAIDINPFHNPYLRDDLLLPELAGAYLEREDARDGMLFADGPIVTAFKAIGWSWGGEWNSLKDWHHFSQNGR